MKAIFEITQSNIKEKPYTDLNPKKEFEIERFVHELYTIFLEF